MAVANVVGGVVVLTLSALVPLLVARAALSLVMALMTFRETQAGSGADSRGTIDDQERRIASVVP